MERKIIFFDIDGTLISGGSHKIPESAINAIKKARENGHVCIINTGRTKAMVGEELTGQVEFDGILMGCGTMIEYHGVELFHHTFPKELSERILEGLERHHIDALLEGVTAIYNPGVQNLHTKTFYNYVVNLETRYPLRPFSEAIGNYDKFFSYVDHRENMEHFAEEFSEELDFIDRENGFYEVVPKGFSKAGGMEYLANWLNISMDHTVAIGDSNNDIPMFECSGTGIAMEKSSADILAMADHVTTDVQQDGIRNALQWLGVLEKAK